MKKQLSVISLILVLSIQAAAQVTESEMQCPPAHALAGPSPSAGEYAFREDKSKGTENYRQILKEILSKYKSSGHIMTWEEMENLKVGMIPFRTKPWAELDAKEVTKLRTFVNYLKMCLEPKQKVESELIKAHATYGRQKQVENFYYEFEYEYGSPQAFAKRRAQSGKGSRVFTSGSPPKAERAVNQNATTTD